MNISFDLIKLKEIALKSFPAHRNKISAALICENGKVFTGFTIRRSSILGSTCAERMALDNWFQDDEKPKVVKLILIGKIMRDGWDDTHICYPCGVCRELYHQFTYINEIKDFRFDCYSWDLKNRDIKSIKDLLFYGKPFYEQQ